MTVLDEAPAALTAPVDPRFDLAGSIGALRRGAGDPTYQTAADGAIWLGCRTPAGEAGALRLFRSSPETVSASAWGPGAAWLLASVPGLLGGVRLRRGRAGFSALGGRAGNPTLVQALRRHQGLRVIRTGRVFDALVPAVLEQRVTVSEAHRAWRLLVREYGEAAPVPPSARGSIAAGPGGLGPDPVLGVDRTGVDGKRSRAILARSRRRPEEETVGMSARRQRAASGRSRGSGCGRRPR